MTDRLEVRGLFAGYGGHTVLRGVDLIVPSGTIAALIGPNGAGKTTLLRCASGLLRPSRGSLLIDGEDVTGQTVHELARRRICHVPEGRAVFPSMTVRENLILADQGVVEEPLERAIEAFPRLGQRMQQTAGTMSGGEQRMLALARAYITNPRYVLLDEVSMGLSPKVLDEIFQFLARLAAAGAALLIVEQYVRRVLDLADIVYVLDRGRVMFAGQPLELDAGSLADAYLRVGVA